MKFTHSPIICTSIEHTVFGLKQFLCSECIYTHASAVWRFARHPPLVIFASIFIKLASGIRYMKRTNEYQTSSESFFFLSVRFSIYKKKSEKGGKFFEYWQFIIHIAHHCYFVCFVFLCSLSLSHFTDFIKPLWIQTHFFLLLLLQLSKKIARNWQPKDHPI